MKCTDCGSGIVIHGDCLYCSRPLGTFGAPAPSRSVRPAVTHATATSQPAAALLDRAA